jgi:ABC-type transport system involved in cytochrome bd biosynthesis fused ATPase/permease subunit
MRTTFPFKDWGKLFHNAAAASAIADRLVHLDHDVPAAVHHEKASWRGREKSFSGARC